MSLYSATSFDCDIVSHTDCAEFGRMTASQARDNQSWSTRCRNSGRRALARRNDLLAATEALVNRARGTVGLTLLI